MSEERPAKIAKLSTNGSNALQQEEEIQATIERIDETQSELDSLNEKASEEILLVENKYNKLREPFYKKRSDIISSIKGFWLTVFTNHPQISALLTEDDEDCLQHLTNVHISDKEDIKSGYKITFTFDAPSNPYFTNAVLEKEITLDSENAPPSSKGVKIDWKSEKNLIEMCAKKSNGGEESFFQWFVTGSEDGSGDMHVASDELAEVLKDDIWPNPLQFFVGTDDDDEDEDDEDGEQDDDEGNYDEDEG